MPKNSGLYETALQEHLNGKTLKDLLSENPDIKRSTFYSYKKKHSEGSEGSVSDAPAKTKVSFQLREKEPTNDSAPAPVPVHVQDDFLSHQMPDRFMDIGADSRKSSLLASFGDIGKSSSGVSGSAASMMARDFADLEMYDPQALRQAPQVSQQESMIKGGSLGGHGKSWWSKMPKFKKEQTPEQQRSEQQMIAVQKVRLYLMHFPHLEQLHIIPKKKSGEPDTEKYLISLYTKKQADLEKVLDFLQFHVRNCINEQTSTKMATNVITTGSKVLEHVLVALGLKVQGLTKNLMEDEDVDRCIKEILIENSINTFNLGPKADLGLKLMMKIVSTDSSNRIEETVKRKAEERVLEQQKQSALKNEQPKPVPDELQAKYDDL